MIILHALKKLQKKKREKNHAAKKNTKLKVEHGKFTFFAVPKTFNPIFFVYIYRKKSFLNRTNLFLLYFF